MTFICLYNWGNDDDNNHHYLLAGYTHLHSYFFLTGITLIVALALFPVFFGADFAHQFCGASADYYVRGLCTMDWALFLGMVVTACTLYLPAFAIFSMNISEGLNARLFC